MTLLKLAVLGAVGYGGYQLWRKRDGSEHAAFAPNQTGTIREAGPQAMRDAPQREWTEVEEDGDESFPASDAPGNY